MYTKEDLKRQLETMGLTGKETILIHSSMKAIGEVEDGADTVLDAWMEYFAERVIVTSNPYLGECECRVSGV